MHMPVSSIFVIASAIWLISLSVITMLKRRQHKVAVGVGKSPDVERAMRAQANAAEYLPMMGLLMMLAELQGANQDMLKVLGGSMLLGRFSHAFGLLIAEPAYKNMTPRVFGMVFTWGPLSAAAVLVFCLTTGLI